MNIKEIINERIENHEAQIEIALSGYESAIENNNAILEKYYSNTIVQAKTLIYELKTLLKIFEERGLLNE